MLLNVTSINDPFLLKLKIGKLESKIVKVIERKLLEKTIQLEIYLAELFRKIEPSIVKLARIDKEFMQGPP